VNSPAGFGAEPRPPKGFPLFSALGMASPVIALGQTDNVDKDVVVVVVVDEFNVKCRKSQKAHRACYYTLHVKPSPIKLVSIVQGRHQTCWPRFSSE